MGYAVILGIIEGLTEFIPVSSTGHLIVAGHLLGFEGPKAATFEIFIQLGAILAVVFLFKSQFLRLCMFRASGGFAGRRGIILLGPTTIPALFLGAAAHRLIKAYLFTPASVALGLGIGGVGILVMEWCLPRVKKSGLDALNYSRCRRWWGCSMSSAVARYVSFGMYDSRWHGGWHRARDGSAILLSGSCADHVRCHCVRPVQESTHIARIRRTDVWYRICCVFYGGMVSHQSFFCVFLAAIH